MITIGLTGWTDHPLVAPNKKRQLEDYASHFPFVEMDTSYYAIPSEKNINNWVDKTPDRFQFIPKAFHTMTLHQPWDKSKYTLEETFAYYRRRFQPMLAAQKVKAFLFQFPPFFRYSEENIAYLKQVREWMGTLPIAIEFRHRSWYSDENQQQTLKLLTDNQLIQVAVDQPQTPSNSVPTILHATNQELSLYRLHGRNYSGWLNANTEANWRETRTLHDYTEAELLEIKDNTLKLTEQSQEVSVIFNNNSGGHAAKNAKELQKMLGLDFQGLHPQQLNLF